VRILVAGATGFIGRRLAPALLADGHEVRCLVRDPDRARRLGQGGCELVSGDLGRDGTALSAALEGTDVAYYLVHMMTEPGYAEPELAAARRFAQAAGEAGTDRVVYLGGLGDDHHASPHLRSRHATAEVLGREGPPLTYFRAAMVIGARSESFLLLRAIAERLPLVPSNEWLHRRSQPIGIREVIRYLRMAPSVSESRGREVQVGGPQIYTHLELVDLMARELGRRKKRKLPVFGATPGAVSAGAAIVTRGDQRVAAELTRSLVVDTVVSDPSGAKPFGIEPEPIPVALQRALEEEEREGERAEVGA
jgi:uncharacterized protein YbjT (DUF2867 family)